MLLSMVVNLSCFPARMRGKDGRGEGGTSRGNGLVC